jgi:HlyD family secretion protein
MRLLKNPRLIIAVLVVAAIVAAALWPDTLEVDVVAVTRGPLQVTLDEDGETRVRERFVVSAPVSGRLGRIELDPGDPVVAGKTLLARITPADSPLIDSRTRNELAAGLEAATAAVGQARAVQARTLAELDRARTTLRRQQELMKAGAIASDNLESAETAVMTVEESLRAAEFAVARTEHERDVARARLQAPGSIGRAVTVVATVTGVVLRRLRESETVVPVGEPLLEIGDPSRIEIVADLLSTDAVRVAAGNRVLIEQWGGGRALEGTVRRVEPSGFMKVSALGVEERRVNVVVDFADGAEAARALGDGYRVEVRVVVWEQADVVTVPVGALFRRGEGWAAFVVDNGVARLRPVELGQRSDVAAQILNGLTPGQAVVLHPPDTLADGGRLRVRPAPAQ